MIARRGFRVARGGVSSIIVEGPALRARPMGEEVAAVAGSTPRIRGGAAAFPKIEAGHVTDAELVARARALAGQARRLPSPSSRRPEAFHEGKSELAHELDELVVALEQRFGLRLAPAR